VPEHVVLLHGFGGTRRAWDGVVERLDPETYLPLALDLPGHGELADEPGPISFASSVASVLARAPARFTLCGYSMGGRIALHVALAAPQRVARLVLISTAAGIEDPAARRSRRADDERLADELEHGGYEEFIARWRAQPVFAGELRWVAELAAADQRRNRPGALAAVLRGVGAGSMEPQWGRLGELAMPALVLAGERDQRYTELGRRMAALLPAGELRILPGRHALVLESPQAVADAIATGPGILRSG
jgi:2-succinyl-6-hydroxy-2,4-cyclohexadiene-1-carboxylate synthase